jgi:hypothetical protein
LRRNRFRRRLCRVGNHRTPPELAVWALLILAVAVCYIVRVGSAQWRAIREAEIEGSLKEQMIQRGMSAREIAQVVQEPIEVEAVPPAVRPSPNRRWLWLAVGLPLALFVLCSGLMMATASVVVVASEDAREMPFPELPAPEGFDQ